MSTDNKEPSMRLIHKEEGSPYGHKFGVVTRCALLLFNDPKILKDHSWVSGHFDRDDNLISCQRCKDQIEADRNNPFRELLKNMEESYKPIKELNK